MISLPPSFPLSYPSPSFPLSFLFSFHPFFLPFFLLSLPCSFPLLPFLPLCLFFASMSLKCTYWVSILASRHSWNILSVPRVTSAVAVLGVAGSFPPCKPQQLQTVAHRNPRLPSLSLFSDDSWNVYRKWNQESKLNIKRAFPTKGTQSQRT